MEKARIYYKGECVDVVKYDIFSIQDGKYIFENKIEGSSLTDLVAIFTDDHSIVFQKKIIY